MGKKRNVLHKQTQEVQNIFKFELALNGPAKKIHNKNNFSLCRKGKKYIYIDNILSKIK